MSIITRACALAILLGLPAACADNQSSSGISLGTVTDTLGLKFDLNCGSGLCVLVPQNSAVAALSCSYGSGTDAFVLATDPVLSIYALHVSYSGEVVLNAADPSHPVACAVDAECPTGLTNGATTKNYACGNGLCLLTETCQNSVCTPWDGALLIYDVLTLCQADLDWPTSCPYITSQPLAGRIAEVSDLCGSNTSCAKVPAACRQLTAAPTPVDGGAPSAIDAGS